MSNIQPAWWVIGCAVAGSLGACHSAPTRVYGVDPTASATRLDGYRAPALRVDTLNIPASWDRSEILGVSAAGELQMSDFDHWSAPLGQIVRQALSADLDQRLPSGSVIFPRLPKPPDALGVDVDILEFDVAASQASMRASWLIEGPQNGKRGVASLQSPMMSTEPAAVALAWSALIGQLADRIAADAASFKVTAVP